MLLAGAAAGSADAAPAASSLIDLVLRAKLVASDGRAFANFGTSVAIGGNTLVVGAPQDVVGGKRTGSAYVFVEPVLGWHGVRETAKLTVSDAKEDAGFGWVVAISGDTVLVTAPFADAGAAGTEGAAYVFVKPPGGWRDMTETAKLTASDAAFQDDFGSSAAIDGDTVVVGAPTEDGGTGNHQLTSSSNHRVAGRP